MCIPFWTPGLAPFSKVLQVEARGIYVRRWAAPFGMKVGCSQLTTTGERTDTKTLSELQTFYEFLRHCNQNMFVHTLHLTDHVSLPYPTNWEETHTELKKMNLIFQTRLTPPPKSTRI